MRFIAPKVERQRVMGHQNRHGISLRNQARGKQAVLLEHSCNSDLRKMEPALGSRSPAMMAPRWRVCVHPFYEFQASIPWCNEEKVNMPRANKSAHVAQRPILILTIRTKQNGKDSEPAGCYEHFLCPFQLLCVKKIPHGRMGAFSVNTSLSADYTGIYACKIARQALSLE